MPKAPRVPSSTPDLRPSQYPSPKPPACHTLPTRTLQSKIALSQLHLSDQQKTRIKAAETIDFQYDGTPQDQLRAQALLASLSLDADGREEVDSRWRTRWNSENMNAEETTSDKEIFYRVLYSCVSGYDHKSRGAKARHATFDYTGCIAHVEVTYSTLSRAAVRRIRGVLDHDKPCCDAVIARMPARRLHPSVYEVALGQLRAGASIADIQAKNTEMANARAYPGQPSDLSTTNFRFVFESYDTGTLYRQFNRIKGVDTREKAHINIDEWLDPKSPRYDATFAASVFHYSARAAKNERFEVCVSTPDMDAAAWKYAHRKQGILDGTFGVCDSKILVFIMMAVDDANHGVPIAFFFFSAPSGNQQTSSGYNTDILIKLITRWREHLGTQNGEKFYLAVAITDTDLKERAALLAVFAGIWLLICRFHLRQSWKNHRNKLLKGDTPIHKELRGRLRRLEDGLATSTDYSQAKGLIAEEARILREFQKTPAYSALAGKAIQHVVEYLSHYWMPETLWQSWSDFGRNKAASILGTSVLVVLPTTNHLESFNNVLKNRHLRRWQRGGRRLRLDVLLHLLVGDILPSIFQTRQLRSRADAAWKLRLSRVPGGAQLAARFKGGITETLPKVAFLAPDVTRDEQGLALFRSGRVSSPAWRGNGVAFHVYSSHTTGFDSAPVYYAVWLGYDGSASCTCRDFQFRGGACKHMRAALCSLNTLRLDNTSIPFVPLPDSEHAAYARSPPSGQPRPTIVPAKADTDIDSDLSAPIRRAADAVTRALAESDGEDSRESVPGDVPELDDDDGDESEDDEEDSAMLAALQASSAVLTQPSGDAASSLPNTSDPSRIAFSAQVFGRVTFELNRLGALLPDLTTFLSAAEPDHLDLHNRAALERWRSQYATFNIALSRILGEAGTATSSSQPTQPGIDTIPVPTLPRKGKENIPILFPPSPEKQQKRKNSHAPH